MTLRSFSAASRRGLGRLAISTPVSFDDQLGELAHAVRLGDLVEHRDLLAALGRVLQGDLDAAHGVADVDERPGLAAGAVHGQRVADRRLHEEAVEHGAVVAVVVEAVDEALVEGRLGGLGAPDDALVQVGDPQCVVRA